MDETEITAETQAETEITPTEEVTSQPEVIPTETEIVAPVEPAEYVEVADPVYSGTSDMGTDVGRGFDVDA